MQGVILTAGRARNLILGDDGNRYAFTLDEWQGEDAAPAAGMRVDFEVRDSAAVDIFPIPGDAPTPPAASPAPPAPPAPPVAPKAPPAEPAPEPPAAPPARPAPKAPPAKPASEPPAAPPVRPAPPDAPKAPPAEPASAPPDRPAPPAGGGFGKAWWHWALAVGALAVVGIVAAFALGPFGPSGTPIGKEIARHSYQGNMYVLVEYGDELAIFSASGAPVTRRDLAEGILRSYAWRQALGDFDDGNLAATSAKVRRLDDSVSGVRSLSNDVVYIFDELEDIEASVPLLGSVSAMDVVRESFPGVSEAEDLVRALDSELNALGDNSASLARASERIRGVEPSSVSGDEMAALFDDGSGAARDLASSVREVRGYVSDAREAVGDLAGALRSGSGTPIIGDTLGDFARSAGRFESELSGLSDLLGGFESELGSLAEEMEDTGDSANDASQDYAKRWLAEPYDSEWPPADPERRPAGAAAQPPAEEQGAPAPAATPAPGVATPSVSVPSTGQSAVSGRQPFKLEWEISESSVEAGEGFILTVRMYDVGRSGEHGGISVSFPSLGQSGGPEDWYSTPAADVEAVDYTSGLSRVAFHHPGASIYHREGNRQFPADYLLVESDDPSWSTSDDRTLALLIVPKRAGELPIQIRGWLCGDGYTECGRNPSEGGATDQQGWVVEQAWVSVTESSAAPAPTPMPTPVPAAVSPPVPAPTATPARNGDRAPFELEWIIVETGESFSLTVRMHGVREAGEHGGISVSFPSLTESGGSKKRHSSSIADVEAFHYTSGLSNVTFHQPGAPIYHREGNRQFPADYLLVESDDPSWSTSDDRALGLLITPKAAGELPIQVRGWLCRDGYTDCGRNPSEGSSTDQQGWFVEVETVSVAASAAEPAPTATPAPDVAKPSVSVPLTGQSTVSGRQPFKLEWEVSESSVEAGEGFILTVRMYDVGRSGEHGGISVSFPSLGKPKRSYSTPAADVEAVDYTSGLSNVAFHHPGADIYHRQDNRQFPADYLLVESDDPSWSSSDDRTLALLITPKRSGEFPIQIRGWLCGDGYTGCGRNPSEGSATDQQGWAVEVETVNVSASATTPALASGRIVETRLTDNDADDYSLRWSPDGRRIAFMSERDGNHEIYVMNADGSGVTRLTHNDAADGQPIWSPDGRRIAFDSYRAGTLEIYVMNADGSGVTRLTDNDAYDYGPSWSPDGRRIAFMSYRDGNWEIYVMNADGSGVTRLTDNDAWDGNPSWSPDGRRIAFHSRRDGNSEIYVMNADGSGVTQLTNNEAGNWGPSWSPDGRRIMFTSDRDGNHEIYVMNADGSGVTRLTDNEARDWYPSWSPDGRRIAFMSDRDLSWDIYVLNADGSGVTRLTDNEADNLTPILTPIWSPDGRRIAFVSDRDGNYEIYVMNADGSG